ncbi:family 43 glycosylhydrolase [Nocardioides anomalus]|uniref:Family 43 glycosylhydrolase n=1 Tax=Nocardioides anomalus TaxID=2712223 RepID=A0A6G6WF97_9ACTN|nr:family 43 glycosylhydrolase [Nocardioides anomalus]QIG44008.1 family 43 glycosylhydrolase [Nocardioides anomalus]
MSALVLALAMTLLASVADGASGLPSGQRAKASADTRWEPGHSKAGRAKVEAQRERRAQVRGARFRAFHDRILGAQPVLSYRGAADPTVARYAGGWVAISTGPGAPRAVAPAPGGPWTNIPSALTVQPSWAISGRYWASDLVQVGGVWLLYFSAEVAGLGIDGRCIGVATATDPTGAFVPDETPLVCPKQAATPRAYDRIKRRGKDLPVAGVIDPDHFKDKGGKQYLTYRTQSTPSTIRIVELPDTGRPVGSARSSELVRRGGVIENPTLLRRGRQYLLLTSEGDFRKCGYKTTFRRSASLLDWSRAKRQVLVDSKKSGLCGPGGADLSTGPNGEPLLFFHAWTCPELGGNCPSGTTYNRDNLYDARRSMFAATLRFTSRQSPRIAAYVTPILPPPPPPTPTPTPTVSVSPTTTVSAAPRP